MSNSRTKLLLLVSIAVLVVSYLALTYLRRPQPSFQEAAAFVRSIHTFVESRAQRGSPLPTSIQLHELVEGGYITPDTARRFDGSQIMLPPGPSPSQPLPLESAPQRILISLRLPDGRETVMTADGSIHQSVR